jgi:hypothetical protein
VGPQGSDGTRDTACSHPKGILSKIVVAKPS